MSSRIVGVSWDKQGECWCASIMSNRQIHCVGYYDNESDASKALDAAEVDLREFPREVPNLHGFRRPKTRSDGVNKYIGIFKDEKSAHEAAASQPRLPTIVSTVDLVSMLEADPTDASRRMPRSRRVRSNR